jgi:hypothetical protein
MSPQNVFHESLCRNHSSEEQQIVTADSCAHGAVWNVHLEFLLQRKDTLITLVPLSEARNIFAYSNTGIVVSNPTRAIDVSLHLFCFCFVLCR